MFNVFFKNNGPLKVSKLINANLNIKLEKDLEIHDIRDLVTSQDITFYQNIDAQKTKASFCLTTELLK